MADTKISALTSTATLDDADEFAVAAAGVSKKITVADLRSELGGGGGSPVDVPPSSPDPFDDEFDDASTLAGDWTAYGDALDVVDIDTTVPGRLYMLRNAGTNPKVSGHYKAIPAFPCTILVKQGVTSARENYHRGNCIVLLPAGAITDGSPCGVIGQYMAGGYEVLGERRSDLSSFVATDFQGGALGLDFTGRPSALYYRLIFNTTTSVAIDVSYDGIAWHEALTAWDPLGAAMDKIGWGIATEGGGTYPIETSWDYIRRVA